MADRKGNKEHIQYARELRKNMTREEKHLWYDFLRNYPIKFTRQKILGKYIADFYCAGLKLAIELDGSQHYTENGRVKDKIRTEYLKEYDIEVLRIPNSEVRSNFRGVCEYIDHQLELRKSLLPTPQSRTSFSPAPLAQGSLERIKLWKTMKN